MAEDDPNVAVRPAVVLAVHQTLNRSNGGVESITQVLEQVRSMRAVVLTNRETARSARWRAAGHEVVLVPFGTGKPWQWLRSNRVAARLIRQYGARVLHANDITGLMATGYGARCAGARVLFNVRDVKQTGTYGWKWRVARLLSHRIVALSQEMREALRDRLPSVGRYGEQSLDFIYSAVDFARMHPLSPNERARLRVRLALGNHFTIAVVAAIMPKKRQLDLARRIPAVWRQQSDWRIHLVGDCPPESDYAQACRAEITAAGLTGRVIFNGYTDSVESWYQASDAVLLVSEREGLARAMIEALACGTPVVSFDVCSAREILEAHDCGAVVPVNDWDGLWRLLDRWRQRPEEAARLGQRGAEVANRLFAIAPIGQAYECLWRDEPEGDVTAGSGAGI